MLALDKKLWRELWDMRMQALAIAMVIVSGVGIFIMSLSTLDSLYETRESYYRDHHFAHIFASLKRAPLSLVKRIEEIPGVDKVETRVVAYVNLDVEGFEDPVSGHILSLPDNSRGLLNQIYLREGRLLEPGRDNEIVLSEEFARRINCSPATSSAPPSTAGARHSPSSASRCRRNISTRSRPVPCSLTMLRYGVLWIARQPLATAYDMEGAFNNVTLTLSRGTNEQEVIDRLDDILKDYGGIGTIARKDQFSNRFLSEELKQQRTIATIFPVIFFGVAAFLLNVVISRLIRLQREEIATLKAFGYSDLAVGLHLHQAGAADRQPRRHHRHRCRHLDGQGHEQHLHGDVQPAVHDLRAQTPGHHRRGADQYGGRRDGYAVRGIQCGAAAAGTGDAAGTAGEISHHAGRTPGPAALAVAADAHDPAPYRTPPAEVADDHARHRHGLRHHDGQRFSGRRHQLHGGGTVRHEPARRHDRHLYRTGIEAFTVFTAEPAGCGTCRRFSRGAGKAKV